MRVFRHLFIFLLSFICLFLASSVLSRGYAVQSTTDWISPHTIHPLTDNRYISPSNALERDGNFATINTGGGLLAVTDFTPINLPNNTIIDQVEIRFHLAGVRTTYRFSSNDLNWDCRDHTHPGFYKDFFPSSTTIVNDYVVNYTSQDCTINPDYIKTGNYRVEMLRFIGTANYKVDDIAVRFTYSFTEPPPGPTPFLRLPWKYEDNGLSFTNAAMSINSYFDHTYPLLSRGTVLSEPSEFQNQVTTYIGEKSTIKSYSSHDGYDWGKLAKAIDGEPMVAAAAGVATLHSSKDGCGNAIYIDHDNGFQTRYCHMQKDGLIIQAGESVPVSKGQVLGKIGATGNVTGPHVHFMVVEDKNKDGNFEDNIPDGLVDPFGWQSTEEDPWETYIFNYLGISRTGNKSHYLWDTALDGKKESVPTTGKTISNEKYKFIFDANSFATNFDFSLNPLPISDPSDDLISAGYVIDAQAKDSFNNIISQFLKPFTIEISFDDFDISNIDPNTLSIYSSQDGKTWVKEQTSVDLENKKATATIDHLTQFALMGEKLDNLAPTTQASLSGQLGQPTFYRSDVTASLLATDNENGLGVDYILYNTDDTEWQTYTEPLTFTEGEHTIQYYSVDKATNVEEIKSVTFSIDKKNPELEMSYDLENLKLNIQGIDDGETTVTRQRNGLLKTTYMVSDQAGNKVVLKTSGAEIGKQVLLSLDSLQYNTATPTALIKHALAFTYADKQDQITHFNQYFQVQNDKKIDLLYIPKTNQTKIVTVNGKGNKVTETKDGIYLLKLTTNQGTFEYTTDSENL